MELSKWIINIKSHDLNNDYMCEKGSGEAGIFKMFPFQIIFHRGGLTGLWPSDGCGQQQGEIVQGGHGVPPPPHTLRREDHTRQWHTPVHSSAHIFGLLGGNLVFSISEGLVNPSTPKYIDILSRIRIREILEMLKTAQGENLENMWR